MHALSTRTLSALAFDRGEEYDPRRPLSASALANLELRTYRSTGRRRRPR
jgi:hypothetical protein